MTETQQLENCFSRLPQILQDYLAKNNITTPTYVQEHAIEVAMNGRDILAQSPTGSGKTLAFIIPLAINLAKENVHSPRALILVPTRELAQQVAKVTKGVCDLFKLKSIAITGGDSYYRQKKELKSGIDIIIGTPGRMIDLSEQGIIDFSALKYFVLDEVDEMLDIGFADALEKIRSFMVGLTHQTLFFSATLNKDATAIARKLLTDPINISAGSKQQDIPQIEHKYTEVQHGAEVRALINLMLFHNPRQALIFCATKQECADVANAIQTRGFNAAQLNSDLSQENRIYTMDKFRNGTLQYLVATNIAARGLDISDLPMVINLGVPWNKEAYTHRVGRTGRAGNSGIALTIVHNTTARTFKRIMSELKIVPVEEKIPNASDVVAKGVETMLQKYLHNETKFANRTIEKAVGSCVDNLSQEEMKNIFVSLIAENLSKLNVYYSDTIVVKNKLINWDEKSEKRSFGSGSGSGGGRGRFFGKGTSNSSPGASAPRRFNDKPRVEGKSSDIKSTAIGKKK